MSRFQRNLLIGGALVICLGVFFGLSRVIVFTNYFSTAAELSRPNSTITEEEIFAILNDLSEFTREARRCQSESLGWCFSDDGIARFDRTIQSPETLFLDLSTEELTGIWNRTPDRSRHDAFAERVLNAIREMGVKVTITD